MLEHGVPAGQSGQKLEPVGSIDVRTYDIDENRSNKEVSMNRNAKLLLVTILGVMVCFSIGQAKQSKSVTWLGVYTQTVDHDLAEAFNLRIEHGAIVNEVVEDSPADEAGIEEDDIIIVFDGAKVADADELTNLVQDGQPGDRVVVTVLRDGREKKIAVTLGKRRSLEKDVWVSRKKAPRGKSHSYSFSMCTSSYIGVMLMELSEQLGEYFGVSGSGGVLISEVEEDSPAMKAGLKAGDVIIAVDGDEVDDAASVQKIIRKRDEGDKVDITVIRNRRKEKISVEVGEREDRDRWLRVDSDLDLMDLPLGLKAKRLFKNRDFDTDRYFDAEDLEEQMEKLREELREMKKELRHLKKSLE